jgi:hypothetical protein
VCGEEAAREQEVCGQQQQQQETQSLPLLSIRSPIDIYGSDSVHKTSVLDVLVLSVEMSVCAIIGLFQV